MRHFMASGISSVQSIMGHQVAKEVLSECMFNKIFSPQQIIIVLHFSAFCFNLQYISIFLLYLIIAIQLTRNSQG